MSRGQLTYYYRTKEEILSAVLDWYLMNVRGHLSPAKGQPANQASPWDTRRLLNVVMPVVLRTWQSNRVLYCLHFAFLAQVGHRDDYRRRLAVLFEENRRRLAETLAADKAFDGPAAGACPHTLAALIQAILIGLAPQLATDPTACDVGKMLDLCLDVVGSYLGNQRRPTDPRNSNGPPAGPDQPPEPLAEGES